METCFVFLVFSWINFFFFPSCFKEWRQPFTSDRSGTYIRCESFFWFPTVTFVMLLGVRESKLFLHPAVFLHIFVSNMGLKLLVSPNEDKMQLSPSLVAFVICVVLSFSIIWLGSRASWWVMCRKQREGNRNAASLIVIAVPATMIYFETKLDVDCFEWYSNSIFE